jgi:glycogen operon protein
VVWRLPSGAVPEAAYWDDPGARAICLELRSAAETPAEADCGETLYLVFNAGPATEAVLPECDAPGWTCLLDTTRPDAPETPVRAPRVPVPASAVLVFAHQPTGDTR